LVALWGRFTVIGRFVGRFTVIGRFVRVLYCDWSLGKWCFNVIGRAEKGRVRGGGALL